MASEGSHVLALEIVTEAIELPLDIVRSDACLRGTRLISVASLLSQLD